MHPELKALLEDCAPYYRVNVNGWFHSSCCVSGKHEALLTFTDSKGKLVNEILLFSKEVTNSDVCKAVREHNNKKLGVDNALR